MFLGEIRRPTPQGPPTHSGANDQGPFSGPFGAATLPRRRSGPMQGGPSGRASGSIALYSKGRRNPQVSLPENPRKRGSEQTKAESWVGEIARGDRRIHQGPRWKRSPQRIPLRDTKGAAYGRAKCRAREKELGRARAKAQAGPQLLTKISDGRAHAGKALRQICQHPVGC